LWFCWFESPAIKSHSLKFLPYKPSAEYARDFAIKNIRVDGVDRHGRTARFEDDKITRLEGHWKMI
jgi:hypothetical protein